MKHILLIEDNEDHAELITRALSTGLGKVKIHLVKQVKKALSLLSHQKFDLILSDYYLPDTVGEAHIRQLVQKFPEIPVIIITGQGDEKTAARSIKAGADDYIVKTREALQALPKILNRVLTKHQSNLKKKKAEIRKELQEQKIALKNILDEVGVLENKINQLQNFSLPSPTSRTSAKSGHHSLLESLLNQVEVLKKQVQKMFSSGN